MPLHDISAPATKGALIAIAEDTTVRSLTTNTTPEDISGTSLTWVAETGVTYLYIGFLHWRPVSTNFLNHRIRALVDGSSTGVTPTTFIVADHAANADTTMQINSTVFFLITGMSAGSHTVKLQSDDNSSSLDRTFESTHVALIQL